MNYKDEIELLTEKIALLVRMIETLQTRVNSLEARPIFYPVYPAYPQYSYY